MKSLNLVGIFALLSATAYADPCIPINQSVPFIATQAAVSDASFTGGMIPSAAQTVGQVVIGGTVSTGSLSKSAPDGTITLSVFPLEGAAGAATLKSATIAGFVVIDPVVQQDIRNKAAQGVFGPAVSSDAVCVSGVAFDIGYYGSVVSSGRIYLYLNGSQHGYTLYF